MAMRLPRLDLPPWQAEKLPLQAPAGNPPGSEENRPASAWVNPIIARMRFLEEQRKV